MNISREAQVWAALHQAFSRVAPEVELDQLDPRQDLLEQVELDGGELENILMLIEEELGATITPEDLEELSTLDEIVDSLSSQAAFET